MNEANNATESPFPLARSCLSYLHKQDEIKRSGHAARSDQILRF